MSSPVRPFAISHHLDTQGGTETDSRMLVTLRCLLAFSALAILTAPSQSESLTKLHLILLLFYCGFSLIVAVIWYQRDWPVMARSFHWIDTLFYVYLIAWSGSTENYFFLFFFYPILVSAFSWGFREGVMVTLVSTVLFSTVGLVANQSSTIIPACGLVLFGYVISYLGVYEHLLRSRLALLRAINNPWHPRFGVDHVTNANLERLRDFYSASSCILITRHHSLQNYVMYSSTRGKTASLDTQREVSKDVVDALMKLPESLGAYYHDPEGPWWMRYRGYYAYDFDLKTKTRSFRQECGVWLNLLDAKSFATVPYAHEGITGRVFLATSSGWFTPPDIDLLAQASDAIATVVGNIRLVEELITGAAESERLLMSRDLRNYAATLKDNMPMPGEVLIEAMAKQPERLRRFYGIEVDIKSEISPELKGRLAAEVFHIVSESLSNVLRHTSAKKAFVKIVCQNSRLLLQVGNETPAEFGSKVSFMPRSIYERVRTMGGETIVEQSKDGFTVVRVAIPM